jgi:hypothetical protein
MNETKLLHFKGHKLGLREVDSNSFEIINTPFLESIILEETGKQSVLSPPSPTAEVKELAAEVKELKKQIELEAKKRKGTRPYPEVLISQLLKKMKLLAPSANRINEIERPIKSFSLVATSEIKEEAAVLIMSLREFHGEPIMILCDEDTKKYLEQENFKDLQYITSANAKDLEEAKSAVGSRFDSLDTFHRIECIYKKMECIEKALEFYGNTLFLDADIIVVNNLQENFTEDIVLSPHYHDPNKSHMSAYCGLFNAGYIFCADKTFPRFWKNIYFNNSSFYEQEGMNYIAQKYEIDIFPKGHNIGFWRDEASRTDEQIKIDLRLKSVGTTKSFHVHVLNCIDFKNNTVVAKKNSEMRKVVMQFLLKNGHKKLYDYILSKTERAKKTAFIHFGKCAGVYINFYLKKNVMPDALRYNSWEGLPIWRSVYGEDIHRDWSETELTQIANETFHPQFTSEYKMAHNHHINWNMKTVKEFRKNNWLTFTFLRDPKDLICSLYFYARKRHKFVKKDSMGRPIVPGPGLLPGGPPHRNPMEGLIVSVSGQKDPFQVPLDKFINFVLDDERTRPLWVLPDYIDELDYVAEFNERNFEIFLKKYFNHHYVPEEKQNTSLNKGFEYYYKCGEISEETKNKIESDPEYKKYFDYLDKV